MVGKIDFGTETIHYEVQFLAGRRTLAIEVHPDRRVLVCAPAGCVESVIESRVRRRAAWISRQLAEFDGYRPRTPPRQYLSGETHLYLGRQYRLKVCGSERATVQISGDRLIISHSGTPEPRRTRDMLLRWYRQRATVLFNEILDSRIARLQGLGRPNLVVRAMRSRWGSFSRAGMMTLNVDLIRAPRPCIEYVVTHELCHARHRLHDPKFFRLLDQLMPDWKERKRRLELALL